MPTVGRRAIIIADGDVDPAALSSLMKARDGERTPPLVIAADGGASKALAFGVRPDAVIGDGDSLPAAARRRLLDDGVELRLVDAAKDESDTELCLLAALDMGAARISLVGALGGVRPEHTAANLLLLADPRFDEVELEIRAPGARLVRIGTSDGPGGLDIEGRAGDFVSLLPLAGPVEGVATQGLRFPLHGETLASGPARGLSNELMGSAARVDAQRGCLLVVHTARAQPPVEKTGE